MDSIEFSKGVLSKYAEYQEVIVNQQSKIEQLEKEKSLQELEINQISQANQEWQRLNLEKEKRISDLQYRIDITLSEINRAINCCESIETECVLLEIKDSLRGES